MLIRNAMIDGRLTDLRLMHGRVQEMGVGLQKGLYESELDLAGDELRPLTADIPLPPRLRRFSRRVQPPGAHITPGTPAPLTRWRGGVLTGYIDEHAAD
ncbi:MAG: hypothetical protein IJE07_03195 [Clostridia bacterium]|nr:hypothetical protein [Clostridia bacterium]